MPDIMKAVKFMLDIANDDSHGYDQQHRNGPDYDCSSLVATALAEAGFNVSRYSWTGNLKQQLLACGFKEVKAPWKIGDIHLNEKYHVCMQTGTNQITQASINEKGTVTGGKTGDQTGKEIWSTTYYDYPWDCHLRYVGTETKNEANSEKIVAYEYAQQFDNSLAGLYELKVSLYNGAGINKEVLASISTNEKVRCYGYYSLISGVKWLYVVLVKDGKEFVGFMPEKQLIRC